MRSVYFLCYEGLSFLESSLYLLVVLGGAVEVEIRIDVEIVSFSVDKRRINFALQGGVINTQTHYYSSTREGVLSLRPRGTGWEEVRAPV